MLRQAYAHSLFALTAYDKDVLAGVVQLVDEMVRPFSACRICRYTPHISAGESPANCCAAPWPNTRRYIRRCCLLTTRRRPGPFSAMGLTEAAETGCRAFVCFQ